MVDHIRSIEIFNDLYVWVIDHMCIVGTVAVSMQMPCTLSM
jgi:hypothetical protein